MCAGDPTILHAAQVQRAQQRAAEAEAEIAHAIARAGAEHTGTVIDAEFEIIENQKQLESPHER